jgi:arabinofuranosyltransferase
VFAVPVALYAIVAFTHRGITDDGFIYLRVVHMVTSGHGPVFNVGERVEAFTSPMWLATLSLADFVTPFRLEWLAVFLGIGASVGGIVACLAGSSRLARLGEKDALLLPFGALVVMVLAPMWYYATSGLETGISFLWIGVSLWILARWAASSERLPLVGAVVLGFGGLVRPDFLIYCGVFLAVVLVQQWRGDSWGVRLRLVLAAAAVPVLYQLFRMGYYGMYVSNTALTKEATLIRWDRGWRYISDMFGTYWLAVPGLLLLIAGYGPSAIALWRRHARRGTYVLAAFLGAAIANALYIVAIGGDYLHARMLLPPIFAACAPIAALPVTRRHMAGLAAAPWVVVAVVFMRPPVFRLGSTFQNPPIGRMTTEDAGFAAGQPKREMFTDTGLYFQRLPRQIFYRADIPLGPDVRQPEAAVYAVGVMPYAVGDRLYVLDLFGLASTLDSHMRIPAYSGFGLVPYAGQEKPMPPPWIGALLLPPGVSVDPSVLPGAHRYSLVKPTSGREFDEQVAIARAALKCPPLRQLDESVRAPLTPRRFLDNIVHSFANTRLRVPPDPETAYEELCGHPAALASPAPATTARR